MIKAFSSSLSLRLLGIFAVTTILIIVLLISLFSRGMSGQWRRSIQPHLVQYADYVQQDLGNPPSPERADLLAARLPVNIHIYKDGSLVYATTDRQLPLDSLHFVPITHSSGQARTSRSVAGTFGSREAAVSRNRNPHQRILRLDEQEYTVYYELYKHDRSAGNLHRQGDELLIALAAIALILMFSYLSIRHQLAPIRQVQKSVGIMSDGNLEHRIDRHGQSDLDKLANSIDDMAARLQAMLDAKRQLLMAISHELRSPLTRARITTELLPESRHQDRLLEDLHDMERMINQIMESEQLQSNHAILNKQSLDVNQLFKDELQRIAPDTTLYSDPSVIGLSVQADATRLRIVLRNLINNVLEHGRSEDGSIDLDVSLTTNDESVLLRVCDKGPGIAEKHIADVADPFYRPDPSRSRATGGFGLGLSLSRAIVEAHAGTLTITSNPALEPGTCVTVSLPVKKP